MVGALEELKEGLCWEFASGLSVTALTTLTTSLVIDPRLDDGLELFAKIRALELDLLDDSRRVAVRFLVGAIPSHGIRAVVGSCSLDHDTNRIGETTRRVWCVCCENRQGDDRDVSSNDLRPV